MTRNDTFTLVFCSGVPGEKIVKWGRFVKKYFEESDMKDIENKLYLMVSTSFTIICGVLYIYIKEMQNTTKTSLQRKRVLSIIIEHEKILIRMFRYVKIIDVGCLRLYRIIVNQLS